METELELKHIAPYLPYGVNYYPSEKSDLFHDLYADYNLETSWDYITALENKDEFAIKLSKSFLTPKEPFVAMEDGELFLGQFESSLGYDVDDVYASEVKIILRPLNTLDLIPNELYIKTDFEEFNFGSNGDANCINTKDKTYLSDMLTVTEFLFSKHFDVFGLIEKGLAIDINTISHEKE